MTFGNAILAAVIGAVISSGVVVWALEMATRKWSTRVDAVIADGFRQATERRETDRALLSEVLGPVCLHLTRTREAFRRWDGKNLLLEARVVAESNDLVRQILLRNFHLLPESLRSYAVRLVTHYDVWFEVYERERRSGKPEEEQAAFIFSGPIGYPFPQGADEAFLDELTAVSERVGIARQVDYAIETEPRA